MRFGCGRRPKPRVSAMARPEFTVEALVAGLIASGQTVATAESLTGGLIGATLTEVPGASAAYLGGVIVYQTELKHLLGGVPVEILEQDGPVAGSTAESLAAGVRHSTGATWGLAVTGVAGPTSQDGHPPGTVWVGVAGPSDVASRLLELSGDRSAIRVQTVRSALAWLGELALGEDWS